MAFSSNDAQTAQRLDLLVFLRPLGSQTGYFHFFGSRIKQLVRFNAFNKLFNVAAQHNVGSPAGHIGSNRDHVGPSSLGNNVCFARMLLGVENLVRQVFLDE